MKTIAAKRVMDKESADAFVGTNVANQEANVKEACVVFDEDTNEPIVAYFPMDEDITKLLRSAVLNINMSSTKRMKTGMMNLSRTFGMAPRNVILRRESCRPTGLATEAPEQHMKLIQASRYLQEQLKIMFPEIWAKDKEEIKFLLSFEKYQDLINFMVENYRMTDIMIYLKGRLISFYYDTTFKDMFNYITSIDIVIKSKFGRMRYFNNHLCRSDGEFVIAKFLFNNNIEYEYERRYEKSLKRCDFYLTKYNFYIEYMGMYKIKSCRLKRNV
jgi:hypothetical protein